MLLDRLHSKQDSRDKNGPALVPQVLGVKEMAKNKRNERLRCTADERPVASTVLELLRLGFSVQPIDQFGNPVLEPLRIERPQSEAIAS